MRASAAAAQQTGPHAAYWRFHDAVAQAQLTSWLPAPGQLLIDISGPASQAAALAVSAGHRVLHVTDATDAGTPDGRGQQDAGGRAGAAGSRDGPGPAPGLPGSYRRVAADGSGLEFLADECAGGVIAEDRTLSRRLAAEPVVGEIWRVLRPGGRVLASVDSLTRGMAALAEQNHWPHLMDLPRADVVLVPWPDGTITRCYGTEQLRELFDSAGFDVNWIRPRTMLSASTVSYLLERDPGSFRRLVEAELQTSADDSVGGQLVIAATKPGPLPSAAVALGLAGDAPGGGRPGLEPPVGNGLPAVDALAVAAVLDARQRRDDLRPLDPDGLHRRLVPVRLRQVRASVARLHAATTHSRVLRLQDKDGPVEVIAQRL